MRIYSEEISPAGKKRILFACGLEDIKILQGLVDNARKYIPRLDSDSNTVDLLLRLKSMQQAFSKFYGYGESGNKHSKKKDTPCPFCEKILRGERGLEGHIKRVHSKQ